MPTLANHRQRFSILLLPFAVLVASGCGGGSSIAPMQAGSPAQLSGDRHDLHRDLAAIEHVCDALAEDRASVDLAAVSSTS